MRSFFGEWGLANGIWQMAFGERRINLANCTYWANFIGAESANFLPNAVRQQLFAWHTKVGEIDPW